MRKTVKKKEIKESGFCIDCENAYLMQDISLNPIICECKINHERQVARCYFCNNGFKRKIGPPVINEMIKYGEKCF